MQARVGKAKFDLHVVTFWGSLGVVGVWLLFASFHPERRIIPIFTAEGRDEMSKFLRFNFPATAERLGLNNDNTAIVQKPAQTPRQAGFYTR